MERSLTSAPRAVIGFLSCLVVAVPPFIPDEKLIRHKLFSIELGVFLLLAAVVIYLVTAPDGWARVKAVFSREDLVSLAVLVWVVIQAVLWAMSADKHLAGPEFRRVLLAGAAYMAFRLAPLGPASRNRVLTAWALAGTLIALYGVLQKTGGVGFVDVPKMDRIMGTYGNPIFFAAFLVPTFFVTLSALIAMREGALSFVLAAGLIIQAVALFYTETRAAWIAWGLGLIVGLFPFVRTGKIPKWLLVAVAVGGLTALSSTRSVWSREQGHLLIWRDTVRMWKDHPIQGVGLGAFHTNFPSYAQDDLRAKWPKDDFIVNYAHNEFLQDLAEGGLLGFLSFLAIPVLFFRVSSLKPVTSNFLSIAALTLFIQNLFSVDMRFGVSLANAFMLMGLAVNPSPALTPTLALPPKGGGNPHWSRWLMAAGWLVLLAVVVYPRLMAPYWAEQAVRAAPGFFDQRLLYPAKSIADLETLAKQYPDEPAVLEKLAYVYAKEMQTPDGKIVIAMRDKAVQTYQRLLMSDPERLAAHNNLANIYYTTGQTEPAIEHWRKAAALKPDFLDVQLNLGKVLYARGDLKESAAHFKKVLEIDPKNAEAVVYLKRMVE